MQSMRLTNSGENCLRTATSAMFCSLLVRSGRSIARARSEAEVGIDFPHHLARAQIAGQKHQALFEIDRGIVAQPQNALVQHAQQQARHGGRGLFDFVEQHQRKAALVAGHARSASAASAWAAFRDGPDSRAARRSAWPPRAPSGIRRNPPSGHSSRCRAGLPPAPRRSWSCRFRSDPAAGTRPPAALRAPGPPETSECTER